jgi:hypothetical protein
MGFFRHSDPPCLTENPADCCDALRDESCCWWLLLYFYKLSDGCNVCGTGSGGICAASMILKSAATAFFWFSTMELISTKDALRDPTWQKADIEETGTWAII